MFRSPHVDSFLAAYPEQVRETALAARRLLEGVLPGAAETVDESARLIGYCYGPGYDGLICTLIMSIDHRLSYLHHPSLVTIAI
jgi:hypothetical protein